MLLLVLVLLVFWALGYGGSGGDGGNDQGRGRDGGRVPGTITPGPSSSESLISEHPGGRDEVGGGSSGSSSGGADGGTGGSGGANGSGGAVGGGSGGADGGAGGADTGVNGGADTGVPGGAEAVPAGSGLPDCRPGSVEVKLRSTENRYAPGEKPVFHLTVRNEDDGACKVDFGSEATVFTIIEAGDDDKKVWKSEDCPRGKRSALYRVPAGGEAVHTLEWDRRHSTPECGTPGDSAKAGTYLVEAGIEGLVEKVRTSFVLTKD
ncbi:hypothetical protein GCM10010420_48740 [Streptomyces glaucosporus]|uniref:Intracellular proteinase inhibitor BsuPI domain-containing protein n=1 Tax=Streptomyces glaucosporus TaxID=284044 RepID=A0ABN3IT29_9ACTN